MWSRWLARANTWLPTLKHARFSNCRDAPSCDPTAVARNLYFTIEKKPQNRRQSSACGGALTTGLKAKKDPESPEAVISPQIEPCNSCALRHKYRQEVNMCWNRENTIYILVPDTPWSFTLPVWPSGFVVQRDDPQPPCRLRQVYNTNYPYCILLFCYPRGFNA